MRVIRVIPDKARTRAVVDGDRDDISDLGERVSAEGSCAGKQRGGSVPYSGDQSTPQELTPSSPQPAAQGLLERDFGKNEPFFEMFGLTASKTIDNDKDVRIALVPCATGSRNSQAHSPPLTDRPRRFAIALNRC